jgi:hypothetical protein
MKAIALSLCDTDYACDLVALLNSIVLLIERVGTLEYFNQYYSNERVEALIRENIKYQVMSSYRVISPETDVEIAANIDKSVKYLNGMKVLFDEEAVDEILNKDHDGGSAYLLLSNILKRNEVCRY